MNDSKIVLIDSSLRTGGTNENFTIFVSNEIFRKKPKAIKLIDCHIPITFNNITVANNQIVFNDPINATATIPPGAYSITSLASAVQTQMTAVGGQAYTVSYDSSLGRITISAPGVFDIDFTQPNSMYIQLGFPFAATPSATSQTGSAIPSVMADHYIHILSSLVPGIDQGTVPLDGSIAPIPRRILFSIPLLVDSGVINYYRAEHDETPINIENSLFGERDASVINNNILDFELQYPLGTTVDLNGVKWAMRIRFDFEDFSSSRIER